MSVQDLKPNSQDISAFYLANIYQILADSNGSQVIIPPTLPNPSIPFSPPNSAVWVNSLWFLSLIISLTCALLATLLQQWAHRYMKVTQTRYSPHKRARIRAFFTEGVDKLHLPWTVEALPALLHLSLFLFFGGLAVFLFNINHTVFKVAISWMGFCTSMYMCITFLPMFRHDSPYYAPLSSSAWYLYTGILVTLFRILERIAYRCNISDSIYECAQNLWLTYWQRTARGVEREFEQTAVEAPPEIDGRALMWTFESLDEDHELEQFFSGIPGFSSSNVVDDPQSSLDGLRNGTVAYALRGLLQRTWLYNLVSEAIKIRRIAICIRAIDAARLSIAAHLVLHDFFGEYPVLLRSVEIGHSLMSWGNNDDGKNTLFAQGIIACIIAGTQQRDEHWFLLTMHQLGISEPVLRGYLNHHDGDSLLLANLIHFSRQFVRNVFQANWQDFPVSNIFWLLLQPIYDIQDILPELQHDFCSLWNEVVLQRRNTDHPLLSKLLEEIHPIYLTLHQGFTQHDPFPLCSIPSHHINGATILNKVNGVETVEMTHDPIVTAPTLVYHDTIHPIVQPVAAYAGPPSPMPELDPTISHPADEPSRHEVVPGMLQPSTPVTPPLHGSPPNFEQFSNGAEGAIQGTADSSIVTSMVGPINCPHPGGDAVPRHTRNMTITLPPSSIPNVVPSPIPILTVSSTDYTAPHIPVDATVNQSDRTPHDECQ